jgi:hypothetical protein
MTSSFTIATTFTRVHAAYLASKVAADLRQLQIFYGRPSDKQIEDFITELVTLLVSNYLDKVEYGFRRNGEWILVLRYTASDGILLADDRSGRVPVGVDVSGATWYSYLMKNWRWSLLTSAEQSRIEESIPVRRVSAPEPRTASGYWSSDKTYSNGGRSLSRSTFTA